MTLKHLTPQGRLIATVVLIIPLVMLCQSIVQYGLDVRYFATFGVLGLVYALCLLYPVIGPHGNSFLSLGTIFIFAGIFLLPLPWAMLISVVGAIGNHYQRVRDKKRLLWVVPAWNAAAPAMLTYGVGKVLEYKSVTLPLSTTRDWLVLLAVAVGFNIVQTLLSVVYLSMHERKRWSNYRGIITPESTTIEILQSCFGAFMAGWWYKAYLIWPLTGLVAAGLYRVVSLSVLAQQVTRDPKTQLYGARYFEKQLGIALGRSLESGRPTSLVFADLDLLRNINNTYGHLAGDAVLCTAAAILGQPQGRGFVTARFGGEEFVLLLPNVSKSDALALAEDLRSQIESARCALPSGEQIAVTISMGVATCPDDGRTNYDLIRAADHAMYHAKAAGRNRVMAAEGPRAAKAD